MNLSHASHSCTFHVCRTTICSSVLLGRAGIEGLIVEMYSSSTSLHHSPHFWAFLLWLDIEWLLQQISWLPCDWLFRFD